MASVADLDRWAAFGGKVEEREQGANKRVVKTYIGPGGEERLLHLQAPRPARAQGPMPTRHAAIC